MRTALLSALMLFTTGLWAQRHCGSADYLVMRSADPSFSRQKKSVEHTISHHLQTTTTRHTNEPAVIRIPVVVHILYKNDWENVSDEQVYSQIEALNRDFRKKNADTIQTPDRFRPFAADVRIEFVLATATPDGRATTGIIRKRTTVDEWTMDDKIKYSAHGGDNAWNSHLYLNIWVGRLRRLLGYASFPGETAEKDGIVISHTAFGTRNVSAPYNLGRTAVHEAGHWLGLKHIWGDTYCGDDGVHDTPVQGNFTTGCPTGYKSTCSNGPLGDMYMNYMDFTNDACINLFTQGQSDRMRAQFAPNGPRSSLLSSRGLDAPWVTELPPVETGTPRVVIPEVKIRFYPNPVQSTLTLDFDDFIRDWEGRYVSIIDFRGTVVRRLRIAEKVHTVSVEKLKPGVYFIIAGSGTGQIRQKFIKL